MKEEDFIKINPQFIDWAVSIEYNLWQHLQRMQHAYLNLVNCQIAGVNYEEACDLMKELRAAAADMTEKIRWELDTKGFPPQLITDVRNKMTESTLDYHLQCVIHYYNRFVFCEPEYKVQNLSALYFIVGDMAELAKVTPIQNYFKEIYIP